MASQLAVMMRAGLRCKVPNLETDLVLMRVVIIITTAYVASF